MADFDLAYINKITRTVPNLYLNQRDCQTLEHKHDIQHAVNDRFFGLADHKGIIGAKNRITKNDLNKALSFYKKTNKSNFDYIFDYRFNVDGIGRGEFFLYFLYDKVKLGGSGAAGADIELGNTIYEVKEVEFTAQGIIKNLRTGGVFDYTPHVKRFLDLAKYLKLQATSQAINRSVLKEMREKNESEYLKILNRYKKDIVQKYFKDHPIIWYDGKKQECYDVIEIEEKHIPDIEVITQGKIKPYVNVKL